MLYDSSLKRKWDNKNVLDYAIKEAKNEGIIEGEIKGKLEGKLEGITEGKLQIAAEMKREGMPTAQIAKITKLSISEIEKL